MTAEPESSFLFSDDLGGAVMIIVVNVNEKFNALKTD